MNHRLPTFPLLLFGSIPMLLGLSWVSASPPPQEAAKASLAIAGERAYAYVKVLTSRDFSGRQTGHPGYAAAARWVSQRFQEWGLEPLNQDWGYLQPFPSPFCRVDEAELRLVGNTGETTQLEPGSAFLPLLFSDSGQFEAGIVFAGWGISAPSLGYDDYAGTDVKGKLVLCFRGQPNPQDRRFQPFDEHRSRMAEAHRRGAVGLAYIYPEVSSNPNGDLIEGFLPLMISEKVADPLFSVKGQDSAGLRRQLTQSGRPNSFALDTRAHYRVVSKCQPGAVGYNVVGLLRGADPALAGEPVVIGAHLDHCGEHLGILFPGADDNASGSATIMEVARVWAELPRKPGRPVVFVLFGAEESGLIGSTYFAANLPRQFTKVAGMFNLDMTGEGDGARLGYSAGQAELRAVLEGADSLVGIMRHYGEIREVGVRSSDFAPFFKAGVPVVTISSNGPHLAYHQAGDSIFRVNPEIMGAIARFTFLSAYSWADR